MVKPTDVQTTPLVLKGLLLLATMDPSVACGSVGFATLWDHICTL